MSNTKLPDFYFAKSCDDCKIGPSILNGDLSNLAYECKRMMNEGADYIHLDVMDGHFVPNITFGCSMVKCLRKNLPDTPFDMHMMVSEPEKWITCMSDAGAQLYTFHYEATNDAKNCIRKIRESGMKVGIAIKPKTPVSVLTPYINSVDMVLIMTVEPGFGGQKFMGDMMPKVEYLRENYHDLPIEVDGGVSLDNICECLTAGANMIVSGTAIMKASDPCAVIHKMKNTIVDTCKHPHVFRHGSFSKPSNFNNGDRAKQSSPLLKNNPQNNCL